ncbi:hypothetical protein [Sphingobium yanoikuyae]|nr:hypothetical protein [Sphingobium yanoikuyae]
MGEADWVMLVLLITCIWIGWPLYRIADFLRELRDMAKESRK